MLLAGDSLALVVQVLGSLVADNSEASVSDGLVSGGASLSDALVASEDEVLGAGLSLADSVNHLEVDWATVLNRGEAFLLSQDRAGWTGGSNALGSDDLKVLATGGTDADSILLDEVSAAVALALVSLEDKSWLAAGSEALSVLEGEGAWAALADAGLLGGELVALFAFDSLAAASDLGESGFAFDLEALVLLKSEAGWAADALAFSGGGDSEVLGAELSDALSVNSLLSLGAFGDAGVSFEGVSLLADSDDTGAVFLGQALWALHNFALAVDPSRSLGADDLVALAVLESLSVGTGSSDARVSLLLEVLWAVDEDASSVGELESWLAGGGAVSLGSEGESLGAGGSLADAGDSGEVAWAFLLNDSYDLEALVFLELEAFWASDGLALSELGVELLGFGALDAGSVVEGPSGLAGLLDALSVLEGVSLLALGLDAGSGGLIELGVSGAEYLVALGALELVSGLASDSLALVLSADFNELEVLRAGITNTGAVDHLEALFALLDALSVDGLEPGWAGGVDASVELLGVLLVVSALELAAGLSGGVEGETFWAGDSVALISDLGEVLWAADLVAESFLGLEGEAVLAGGTLAGSVLEGVELWALEALSVDQVEARGASGSDADAVGEGEVLFAGGELALLLLLTVLGVSWALDLDAEVGVGVDSVAGLADDLLASGGGEGGSDWAVSLVAGLTIGGWHAGLVAALDTGGLSVELDHVGPGWALGSDALTSGDDVELVADDLLAGSVLSESESGFAGLLDAGASDDLLGDLAAQLDASVSLLDFIILALLGALSVNGQNLVDWAGSSDADSFVVVGEELFAVGSASDVSDESLGGAADGGDAGLGAVSDEGLLTFRADGLDALSVDNNLSFDGASGEDAVISSSDLVGLALDFLAGSVDVLVARAAWNSDADVLLVVEDFSEGAFGNASSVFELESRLAGGDLAGLSVPLGVRTASVDAGGSNSLLVG